MENFKQLLQEWRKQIDSRLSQTLNGQRPSILYDPIKYVLDGEGKRIRPILLMLSCQSLGGDINLCWDAAVAVELLHNFTLVHDDIMDRDDTRRGRATVHKKWDANVALLVGDGLLALAFQSLLQTESPRIREIAKIYTDGIIGLCEGQALDMDYENREDVSVANYFEMIEKKTARLLVTSAKIGAILGEGSERQVQMLGDFAYNLGCAFQLQDDLLDITSDEATLGKTFGSDVKGKKQTYLMIHALTSGDAETQQRLKLLLSESDMNPAQINEVRDIFEKTGSLQAAKTAAEQYVLSAQSNLDELPPTWGKESLQAFLGYISTRNA